MAARGREAKLTNVRAGFHKRTRAACIATHCITHYEISNTHVRQFKFASGRFSGFAQVNRADAPRPVRCSQPDARTGRACLCPSTSRTIRAWRAQLLLTASQFTAAMRVWLARVFQIKCKNVRRFVHAESAVHCHACHCQQTANAGCRSYHCTASHFENAYLTRTARHGMKSQ